jgi:hypothetical protein
MSPDEDEPEPKQGSAFCIECGEKISVDTEFCPECGKSQDPEQILANEESSEGTGFTNWAPGFEPDNTIRNAAVGLSYVLFLAIGIPVLAYGYLKENPESGSKFAWALGVLLILAGLGGFTDGTTGGIFGGSVAITVGIVVLPIVREKIGIGSPPPGIEEGNPARRNAIVSVGYGAGALLVGGAALPGSESSDSTTTEGGGATSSDGGSENPYPNAYSYDEATGIVLESGISAEVNSIGAMYIRGRARNESGRDYSYVQLEFSVLDNSRAKIADALANTSGLDAGQTWRFEAVAVSASTADTVSLEDVTAY